MKIQDLTDEPIQRMGYQIQKCYSSIRRQVCKSIPLEDVEDIVQEVWIRALGNLGKFEGRSALATWLYKIARRVVADYNRLGWEFWRAYHSVKLLEELKLVIGWLAKYCDGAPASDVNALRDRLCDCIVEVERNPLVRLTAPE